jgi:hypothetical protein
MKFVEERPYTKPEVAAKSLLEIASTTEPDARGRIDVGQVNIAFLREGRPADDYRAGIALLRADGLIEMHPTLHRHSATDRVQCYGFVSVPLARTTPPSIVHSEDDTVYLVEDNFGRPPAGIVLGTKDPRPISGGFSRCRNRAHSADCGAAELSPSGWGDLGRCN